MEIKYQIWKDRHRWILGMGLSILELEEGVVVRGGRQSSFPRHPNKKPRIRKYLKLIMDNKILTYPYIKKEDKPIHKINV